MRLLVIGGTSFVGRHAVEAAVADGHDVAVFHRGRTNPGLLEGHIRHLLGDRDTGNYEVLGRVETWDAVVDASAFVPRHVHQLADALAGRVGHYVYVSSVSAYDPARATMDEDSPLYDDPSDATETIRSDTYGPRKAACERAALARFGANATAIVRPAYVCGPYDNEDNFTYWARRMAEGGDVVVSNAAAPVQIIDARDLGAFLLRCSATTRSGVFDAVAPSTARARLLAEITPNDVRVRLIEFDAAGLRAAGVTLPMMLDDPNDAIISSRRGTRARAAGLTTRSLAETAAATRVWDDERGRPPLKVGPSREQEAAILAARWG